MSNGEVLIVHCVDTEGPIGGNVRRRPDGSAEFMDNWADIEKSLDELTDDKFRFNHPDSSGQPYIFNWFIMDFTGFKTNPKKRVARYHDTYDHLKAMPTTRDGFYWHYHHPPDSGLGDQWSDNWESSGEYQNILLHKLVERHDWPESFRAGGTIEDNKCSHWLEDNMMVDYSNRVSERSQPTNNIFDFNWYGAPGDWGYYHPDKLNFLKKGKMRRFIVRCVDLRSRLHELSRQEVAEAFNQAKRGKKVILSYFSHDHRDMRAETKYGISLVEDVAKKCGVSWRYAKALEAVQQAAGIIPEEVIVQSQIKSGQLILRFNRLPYQRRPWIGAMMKDQRLSWLKTGLIRNKQLVVDLPFGIKKIVVGGTSKTGNKFVKVITI